MGDTRLAAAELPLRFLRQFELRNPKFHRQFEFWRRERKRFSDWPAHVYCADNFAITNGDAFYDFEDARLATTMAAWRVSKAVYVFDEALADEFERSDAADIPIPMAVLKRFPDWCAFFPSDTSDTAGAFFRLAYDCKAMRDEINLTIIDGTRFLSVPIPIVGNATISGGLSHTENIFESPADISTLAEAADTVVQRALYVCSDEPDYSGRDRPPMRERGPQFGAQAPTVWGVGARIGAQLRATRERCETATKRHSESGRHSPRPHIRRAHWHGYWTGKKDNQRIQARWIPPTLIGADSESELPAIVHVAIEPR